MLTGGEPMLQVDQPLIDALHARGFNIAIETNGTIPVPEAIDWICVSPKAGTNVKQTYGDELKLVYPQTGLMPEHCSTLDFTHVFVQPMDGPSAPKTRPRQSSSARPTRRGGCPCRCIRCWEFPRGGSRHWQ